MTYQQVLWLDVPVDDVEAVEVPEGLGQVVDHAAGVPLRVLSGQGQVVKQVPSLQTPAHVINAIYTCSII